MSNFINQKLKSHTTNVNIKMEKKGGGIHQKDPSWQLNDYTSFPNDQPAPL
jgi:hypothetical protein